MDTPEPLKEIPTNELISVFSHAIGVHRKLAKIAEEIGRFDIESFDAIGKELNWLKGSLEEIGPHTSKLPPKIRTHAVAVKDIVNDACWKKSYGDICMSFFESKLAEHGNVGWEEVLRLTKKPAISWGEPPKQKTPQANPPYTLGQLIKDLQLQEVDARQAASQQAKVTGLPEVGTKDAFYQRTAIELGDAARAKAAEIAEQAGVDRLRLFCDAEAGAEWSSRWVKQQRAGLYLNEGITQAEADVLTIADLLTRLLPQTTAESQSIEDNAAVSVGGKVVPGPKVPAEEMENRKLVAERWGKFSNDYKKLGYSRTSYRNAAKWMIEVFEDMPFLTEGISDPSDCEQIGKRIKGMVRALKETPTQKLPS